MPTDPPLTPNDFTERLEKAAPGDTDALEALASQTLTTSRDLPRLAARFWADPKLTDRAAKAALVLAALEEQAILPLLESPADVDPKNAAWRNATLVEALIDLRLKTIKHLDAAMRDKRPVPLPPTSPHLEEKPPPRRICDHAYILARRLLNTDEPRGQSLINQKEFLAFPDEKKDAEITTYLKSRTWTQFTEDIGF
jgi:hypothetical protein